MSGSVVAGIDLDHLKLWISPATDCGLAIPVPAVAKHEGATVIMPPKPWIEQLFSPLGAVVCAADREELYKFQVVLCMMGELCSAGSYSHAMNIRSLYAFSNRRFLQAASHCARVACIGRCGRATSCALCRCFVLRICSRQSSSRGEDLPAQRGRADAWWIKRDDLEVFRRRWCLHLLSPIDGCGIKKPDHQSKIIKARSASTCTP